MGSFETMHEMQSLVETYVQDHKDSLDENNIRDYLDTYLLEIQKHQNDSNSSFHQERGHYMLVNTLIDLLIAGMETTSSAIVWTLLLLLHHPEAKRKVLEEIDKVVGKERVPRISDKEEMHYTNAVLEESFRVVSFASVAVPHSATKDIEISDGKHVIPNRFLDENGIFRHNERIVPFGIGKRYCLGQSLAEKEFFLFMAGFLQKYDIAPSPMKKLPSYYIYDNTPENILRMCPEYEIILTSRK